MHKEDRITPRSRSGHQHFEETAKKQRCSTRGQMTDTSAFDVCLQKRHAQMDVYQKMAPFSDPGKWRCSFWFPHLGVSFFLGGPLNPVGFQLNLFNKKKKKKKRGGTKQKTTNTTTKPPTNGRQRPKGGKTHGAETAATPASPSRSSRCPPAQPLERSRAGV